MSKSEEIDAVVDNTNTRDELTFLELLAEHVFDPSSITEPTEDVHILELSEYSTGVPYSGSVTTRSAPSHPLEEPSLVHNNSLMDEEPVVEETSINVEEEPVIEPVKATKKEPVIEPVKASKEKNVKASKKEPVTEPVKVEEEEPITEPVKVEEEEPVTEPVKVEEVKVDETPVVEEPKGVFNKLTSSLFSICNWFVKK